jgi:tagatose-6-phosphate ketose/aldose isomerase
VTTSSPVSETVTTIAGSRFPRGEEEQLAAQGAQATAQEIAQQPAVWREVSDLLAQRDGAIRAFVDPLLALPDLRIVLSGAGTSAFVGEVLAPALARALGKRVDAVATTDVVSNPREVFAQDVPTLFVSFSRSGDSPESAAATQLADRCLCSVHHLVVTCDPDGRLAREHRSAATSLVLLMPAEANDRGFAMTSSFTSMLLATWLVLAPSQTPGSNQLVERLATAAEQVLDASPRISQVAGRGFERIVYLGSGSLGGLARESALKMLELTAGGVVSYFDTSLGFRHGPKAVLHDRTLAVVFLSNDDYTRRYDEDIISELVEGLDPRQVIVLAARETDAVPVDLRVTGLDDVSDALLALPYVVVAQLLALRFSVGRGVTPDNPFPDGEVNRVVRGVTVHPLPS